VIILGALFFIVFFRNANLHTAILDGEKSAVTVISCYEIMAGVRRIKSPKEEKFFAHFFSEIEILDFTLPAARIASDIGARMASDGNRVNAFDILIAGIALAHHAPEILTADLDFLDILKIFRVRGQGV